MKTKILFTLILTFASSFAPAATVSFEVDAASRKQDYSPGDTIWINIVGSAWANNFQVGSIISNHGGIATGSRYFDPIFYTGLNYGTVVNAGSPYVLISNIQGRNMALSGSTPPFYYKFQFQVPDTTVPLQLTIDDYGQTFISNIGSWSVSNITPLHINVTPEPCTLLLFGIGGLMLRKKFRM
jgi:hypothetical protein